MNVVEADDGYILRNPQPSLAAQQSNRGHATENYDFALLHKLGTERIANPSHDALVTKLPNGSLAIAVWNLVDPADAPHSKEIELHIDGISKTAPVSIRQVDETHSNVMPVYRAMGSPVSPTAAQVDQLNRATALAPAESTLLSEGSLHLTLGSNALYLLIIGPEK